MENTLKEFSYKEFGSLEFSKMALEENKLLTIYDHIKIVFIPKLAAVQVDFQQFKMDGDALLFINPKVNLKPIDRPIQLQKMWQWMGKTAFLMILKWNRKFQIL